MIAKLLADTLDLSKPLEYAHDQGGSIYLACLLLVLLFTGGMFYILKVAIPKQKAEEELSKHLADTVAAIGRITGETHILAAKNGGKLDVLDRKLTALVDCSEDIVAMAAKLSGSMNVNVDREIGSINGRLEKLKGNHE